MQLELASKRGDDLGERLPVARSCLGQELLVQRKPHLSPRPEITTPLIQTPLGPEIGRAVPDQFVAAAASIPATQPGDKESTVANYLFSYGVEVGELAPFSL
jgi:hypothetical protein